MIIRYIKDCYARRIHACIVILDPEHVGVVAIKPKGNFSKKSMRKIAHERAKNNEYKNQIFLNRRLLPDVFWHDVMSGMGIMELSEIIRIEVDFMLEKYNKVFINKRDKIKRILGALPPNEFKWQIGKTSDEISKRSLEK